MLRLVRGSHHGEPTPLILASRCGSGCPLLPPRGSGVHNEAESLRVIRRNEGTLAPIRYGSLFRDLTHCLHRADDQLQRRADKLTKTTTSRQGSQRRPAPADNYCDEIRGWTDRQAMKRHRQPHGSTRRATFSGERWEKKLCVHTLPRCKQIS